MSHNSSSTFWQRHLLQTIGISIMVGIWQLASSFGLLNPAFIPSPLSIIQTFGHREQYLIFALDAAYSLSRMIVGILLAYCITLIIMLGVSTIPIIHDSVDALRSILKFVPPPVLIPLAILIVGINNSTAIIVIAITSIFLILDYSFTIYHKEVSLFTDVFGAWKLKPISIYTQFFLPISHYLSYRFTSTLIIWALSVTIFSEIVTGVPHGFGPRLVQLQQLYQSSTLFAFIIGIIALSYSCERILAHTVSRYTFDLIKKSALIILTLATIASILFQSILWFDTTQTTATQKIISTYSATVNLPLFVYKEKFDTLNMSLQLTNSGIQTVDTLVAGRAYVGGYADIPNALSAINQNPQLTILSQSEELPDNPLLYLISHKEVSKGNYTQLSNSKIGYYPNNPIIQSGLNITLILGGASTTNNTYTSGNDPNILSQAFVSNQLDAVLSIEPYITDMEKQTGIKRINPQTSLISGLSFEALPLTALVVNTQLFTSEELEKFNTGIAQSIRYIQEHTIDGRADAELASIMDKYSVDTDSKIPYFSHDTSLNPQNINLVLNLIKQYDTEIGSQLSTLDIDTMYYKSQQ